MLVAQTASCRVPGPHRGAIAGPDPKSRRRHRPRPDARTLTASRPRPRPARAARGAARRATSAVRVHAVQDAEHDAAQFLLTGTMAALARRWRNSTCAQPRAHRLKSGIVVAQASRWPARPSRRRRRATSRLAGADPRQVCRRLCSTTETPAGQRADSYYIERIGGASVIQEATALYNQSATGRARHLPPGARTPQGAQLRAESGVYLSNMKLGRTATPSRVRPHVALGLATTSSA